MYMDTDNGIQLIFAAIPLLSIIVFVPSLLSSHARGVFTRILSLVSIISLLATAYTIRYVPPQRPDPKGKRPVRHPDLSAHIRRYIIPGNSGISAFLMLVYVFSSEASIGVQPVVYLVPVGKSLNI